MMAIVRSKLAVLLIAISTLLLTTPTFAAITSSTFVAPGDNGASNLVFSLNVPKDGDDLFFHMSGPFKETWMAVGIGKEMAGSLVFIVYANANKDNVTASPRLASGNYEPKFTQDSKVTVLAGSGIINGQLVLNAQCSGCRKWSTGSIDVASTDQDFIYSLGPSTTTLSDSPEAPLRQHRTRGFFKMDLKAATGDPGVPGSEAATTSGGSTVAGAPAATSNPTSSGSKASGGESNGGEDITKALHAVFMGITFVFIIPLAVVFIKIVGNVRAHYITNGFAFVTLIVGLALAILTARKYENTMHYKTAHQILGFIVVGFVAIQIALGASHHSVYRKSQRKTTMGLIHRYFGPLVLLLGLVNGILGFNLSGRNYYIIGYVILIGIVALLILGFWFFRRRRIARKHGGNHVGREHVEAK